MDSGGPGKEFTKNDKGVWELTLEPLAPGAYRYTIDVDGVPTLDPRNPSTSESNANAWSLVNVPGSDLFDTRDVPHGAVAEVTYRSQTLSRFRRMHVYTPPGYENGEGKFPVLYLLHGALDCDDSWSTVGRAGFILDNLIAAGKAKPMIVVMPAGHTGAFQFGGDGGGFQRQMEDFAADFANDIRPYVEKHYRIIDDPKSRAIAGLSMGGSQTLNIAFAAEGAGDFGHIGVFSSGIFGIAGGFGGGAPSTAWEDGHGATLDDAELRKNLQLVWFGCGKEDFLLSTAKATVAMLEKHGMKVVYRETEGGHTWPNWRDYLADIAPQLFQE
jgi:enterochelin esterase family protein